MAIIEWKDATSYSRGDTIRVPRTWELKLPSLRIVVTQHIHYPDLWLLYCAENGISSHVLKNLSIDLAKNEAIQFVQATVDRMQKELDSLR